METNYNYWNNKHSAFVRKNLLSLLKTPFNPWAFLKTRQNVNHYALRFFIRFWAVFTGRMTFSDIFLKKGALTFWDTMFKSSWNEEGRMNAKGVASYEGDLLVNLSKRNALLKLQIFVLQIISSSITLGPK